jgi:hypothetical protein
VRAVSERQCDRATERTHSSTTDPDYRPQLPSSNLPTLQAAQKNRHPCNFENSRLSHSLSLSPLRPPLPLPPRPHPMAV